MGWTKWALGGVALFAAAAAVAFGVISTGGITVSAQTPDENKGRGGVRGMGGFERHAELLAEKLNISVEKLKTAQKAAIEQVRAQDAGQRQPGAYEEALAKQLGINVEILKVAQKAAFDQAISEAVAAGRLTPAQAERLKSMGTGAFGGPGGRKGLEGMGHGAMRVVQNILAAAAQAIGISEDKLKEELQSGKSIADIAAANGVARYDLEASMTRSLEAAITKAQADGTITPDQAAKLKQGLSQRLDHVLDHAGGMRGHAAGRQMQPGGPMQRMGLGGPR